MIIKLILTNLIFIYINYIVLKESEEGNIIELISIFTFILLLIIQLILLLLLIWN